MGVKLATVHEFPEMSSIALAGQDVHIRPYIHCEPMAVPARLVAELALLPPIYN
jgi:hypothetical protein